MSGGFFRGTSADQDTRFSNKEAKLLKSQKFPAELDQLVDMSKVKMDVIRPWIANRTTEFLGFEDEVLINFIYGLLDGKEVDGKQIQIQLTGFMEKNTGKFMKELWSLLTSAQKNASGIPQQFLDAKAEETRKKKAETDRINYEIQKKKEQEEREAEQERQNRINSDLEMAKVAVAASVSAKASSGKGSLKSNLEDEKDERRTSRARDRNGDARLSRDGDHSPQSHRSPPLLRRHRSRSLSRSPRHRRHSPSPIRRHRSPVYSPPRRKRSPLYARSPRRRSPSPWRRRPPSPRRRRSPSPPRRRRSPSPPLRRRSPSPPLRRRSPSPLPRRRSPSPLPKRSPSLPPRRRSPSPPPRRRRSPSPLPRRISPSSPPRRRSPSPLPSMRSPSPPPRRRSPSPPVRLRSPVPRSPRYRRRSPARSPRQRQMDSQSPRRQKSSKSRSPQYRSNRSLSREHSNRYSEVETRRYREKNASERNRPKRDREYLDREEIEYERHEHPRAGGKAIVESPLSHENSPIRACAPQHDLRIRGGRPSHMQDSPPPNESSPSQSPSRQRASKTHMNEEKRYSRRMSPYRRQVGSTHDRGNPRESPEPRKVAEHNTRIVGNIDRKVDRVEVPKRRDARAPHVSETKEYGPKRAGHDRDSPIDVPHNRSAEKRIHCEVSEPKRKEYHTYSSDNVDRSFAYPQRRRDIDMHYASEEIEYGPGRLDHGHPLPDYHQDSHSGQNRVGTVLRSHIEYDDEEDAVELNRSPSKDIYADDYSDGGKIDVVRKPIPKPESIKQTVHSGSDSEESEGYRRKHAEKRKAKREELTSKYDDEDVSMSPRSSEEKREAKRRKKEEKRLRKEEKRRRREERHRRKEERRANKAKAKGVATVAQPEKDYSAGDDSEDNGRDMDHSHQSQDEEMEDEQKRLEIELRRKALESLRAKKAISQ